MKHFKAIAAMSLNRVIGCGPKIPWHLPEDFKWFKEKTQGQIVVMGRKTFDSLGKPLPNRLNVVLTRHPEEFAKLHSNCKFGNAGVSLIKKYSPSLPKLGINDIAVISSFEMLDPNEVQHEMFICGGAQIYAHALPQCSDLYLTLVKREVEGDVFFPPFEDQFELAEKLRETPDFDILHYRQRRQTSAAC